MSEHEQAVLMAKAVMQLRLTMFSAQNVIEEHRHDEDGEACWPCFVQEKVSEAIEDTQRAASVAQAIWDREHEQASTEAG